MKARPPRDPVASVRQRLLNLAKEHGEEFNSGGIFAHGSWLYQAATSARRLTAVSRSVHSTTFELDIGTVTRRRPTTVAFVGQ